MSERLTRRPHGRPAEATPSPPSPRVESPEASAAPSAPENGRAPPPARRSDPQPSPDAALQRDVGAQITGRYHITSIIGEGGMGVVYEAWDAQVERRVAIKLVRSDTQDRKFLSRFRRELEITSKLRHPSTIRVFEHGETEDGRPYMVMELLTGQSLADKLEAGPLDEAQALRVAQQVAESLSEAHEHGVFHRDLKPDNIFIETVGVSKVVKVLDFGIAGGVDAARLTQAGEVFGTPQYMSPEQCNGLPLDHRTDIYSLACILYEMLEGRPPFASETPMATMLKHVQARVPPLRRAARETAKVVLMGLRKDRTKRIQTAGRLSELVGRALAQLKAGQGAVREGPAESGPFTGLQIAQPARNPLSSRGPGGPSQPLPLPPTGPADTLAEDRRGRTFAVVLGLLAAGLVTAAFFGDMTRLPTGTPERDHANASVMDPQPPAARTKLPMNRPLVHTNVEGARVYVDDDYRCDAPCEVTIPVGDGLSHEIRLKKEGYVDLVQVWRPKSVVEPLPKLPPMERL